MKKTLLSAFSLLTLAGVILFSGCGERKAEKKVLLMATEPTFPPYEFYDRGKIIGIDADVVREVAAAIGYRVEIISMKFDSVVLAVKSGKCDVGASGITITDERKRQILFTIPYAEEGQVIVVPKDSKLKDVESLKDEEVRLAVQRETTGDTYATKNLHEPQRFDTAALTLATLQSGDADAVICDRSPAKLFAATHPEITILPDLLTKEEYAFVISKDNEELQKRFNEELLKMKKSGRLQQIIDHYLNPEKK